MEDFTFFYFAKAKYGEFSQWYPSPFTYDATRAAALGLDTNILELTKHLDGARYTNAEQFMMHMKAILFKDTKTAQKILSVSTPKEMKVLGRQITSFNQKTWETYRFDIVYLGSFFKYAQNKKLLDILLSTKETVLVEASPTDAIWGIGTGPCPRSQWKGLNLLGEILTKLKFDIMYKKVTI